MGMSASVVLLRSKDDPVYQKYLKILMSCKEADINPPKEVDDYFGGDGIDNDPETPLEIDFNPREWSDEYAEGYEIDIDSLPKGVKTIRFYNSW
ncbi:MAG: hypothetical protein SV062_08195 [Thermodesulfobacteriota bacterium]|nr:hypothetical protein [Thermodesulfobacteriota bacterium]